MGGRLDAGGSSLALSNGRGRGGLAPNQMKHDHGERQCRFTSASPWRGPSHKLRKKRSLARSPGFTRLNSLPHGVLSLQQDGDILPEPIDGEVRRSKWQRKVIRHDRQPLDEMISDAPRDRTDQVGPGDHVSHGEKARLPKHNLAHQSNRGERGVNSVTIHGIISWEHLDML